MSELLFPDESYEIIGACFAVYNEFGCGFLEPVYQECLAIEFGLRQIPALVEPEITLNYRGHVLRHTYVPDFICFDKIIVEVKSVSALADEHRAQVINYLHATGKKLGILVNFGNAAGLKYERYALTEKRHSPA